MPAFLVLQFVFAAVAAGLVASRSWGSLRSAALDARPFERELREALCDGRAERALSVADALRPAAVAELASAVLSERSRGGDARFVLEDMHAALRSASLRGRDEILALGRIATPLALIGVIIELAPAARLAQDVVANERAVFFGRALSHGALAFALGIGTLALCWSAAALIQRRGAQVARDLERVAALFDASATERDSGAM